MDAQTAYVRACLRNRCVSATRAMAPMHAWKPSLAAILIPVDALAFTSWDLRGGIAHIWNLARVSMCSILSRLKGGEVD